MKFNPHIGLIGLGYVGMPLALALARKFNGVVGFDISSTKVEMLKKGEDPTKEGYEDEIRRSNLQFTSSAADLEGCDFFIVGVPTPIDSNRNPDLEALRSASEIVGQAMRANSIVVYESTVYPGVTEEFCGPILERASGLKRGKDFKLGYSPERINPGDKEHSLDKVVKVVSGEDADALDKIAYVYNQVVSVGVHRAPSIKVAEAAKVIENTQRDLNIALMNELAIIFDKMGISTRDVLAAAGTKWNFLRFVPGLVGGHCIGVDPYYLTTKAEQLGYHPQVILSGRRINDDMGKWVAQRFVKSLIHAGFQPKGSRIAVLGVTFKENVTDLRNSRVPDICRELAEFGVISCVHDPMVDPHEAKEEYGIEMVSWDQLSDVNGVIYAVAHDQFKSMPIEKLFGLLVNGGVFADIKAQIEPQQVPKGARYWSL